MCLRLLTMLTSGEASTAETLATAWSGCPGVPKGVEPLEQAVNADRRGLLPRGRAARGDGCANTSLIGFLRQGPFLSTAV